MAEAIGRHIGADKLRVLSAGSNPAGFVHPLATAALDELNVSCEDLRSKSWDEFADTPIDVAITLCDYAASQPCPTFSGPAIRAHWPLTDPSTTFTTPEARLELARQVARTLQARVRQLTKIPFDDLNADEIQARLDELAKLEEP
jgi:arsenate reductase